ncbi:GntR family transcriptional regulator [Pigmentiphaga soli]|uniref:GntR family transcriptional regulator n=1 Tax=Pigmentiphaga soli TaxID=1007095 RepID=UPI0031ED04C1
MKSLDEAPIEDQPNAGDTITMRLYSRLRQDIIEGTLPPGMKLKIEDMSRSYEAGTSPVREALNLLTSFGLVERLHNRGFRVKPISAAEFADLLRVRCWLEERALREAIAHGDEQWEENIALALFRVNRAAKARVASGEPRDAAWERRHRDFHMALLAGCGSPMLLDYCGQLFDQTIRYRQIAGALSMPVRDSEAEHAEIVEATLARKADQAVELLMTHYRTTGKYLLGRLFADAGEGGPLRYAQPN